MLVAEVRNWPPTLTSSYCVVNLLKEEEIRQKGEQQIATTTELKRSHTNFFLFYNDLPLCLLLCITVNSKPPVIVILVQCQPNFWLADLELIYVFFYLLVSNLIL